MIGVFIVLATFIVIAILFDIGERLYRRHREKKLQQHVREFLLREMSESAAESYVHWLKTLNLLIPSDSFVTLRAKSRYNHFICF